MEPIIRTKDLSVIYNQGKSNEVRSLQNVHTAIYPQEYVIIFGPSGCGKSTLLYSIAALQMPTAGEVWIGERQISKMKKKEKTVLHQSSIGMVFQAFYLIPSLRILDNVCLPQLFCNQSKTERYEKGLALLRRFGIAEQAFKYPSELSGGQKQRVAIARALINNPDIILADEPVGNLDSESAQNVLKLLKELNEVDKKTVILVTHDPSHLQYADRILHMKDGQLIREEINHDKRPVEAVKKTFKEGSSEAAKESVELNILLRSFGNLPREYVSALLVPFKAQQVFRHLMLDMSEEQIDMSQGFLREFLFDHIDFDAFDSFLDADFSKGGAGWNKLKAASFAKRVQGLLDQSKVVGQKDSLTAADSLIEFLGKIFDFESDQSLKDRIKPLLIMRLENAIDGKELARRLDMPEKAGGAGLNRATAEKIGREIEMVMLLKY